jgi:ubiquitin-conjugating enzyme E2 S
VTAGTPYEGGFFKVKLILGADFPQSPPQGICNQFRMFFYSIGFFLTKIFHPNVSNKGEICVNTLKKDWKSELGIGHVLLVRYYSSFAHVPKLDNKMSFD